MVLLNTSVSDGLPQLIMFGLIFVIFYFFMIKPQINKQKKEKAYRSALKKGDLVVTIGGIHGKIIDIKKDFFIVEVNSSLTLKIDKNAISTNGNSRIQNR